MVVKVTLQKIVIALPMLAGKVVSKAAVILKTIVKRHLMLVKKADRIVTEAIAAPGKYLQG